MATKWKDEMGSVLPNHWGKRYYAGGGPDDAWGEVSGRVGVYKVDRSSTQADARKETAQGRVSSPKADAGIGGASDRGIYQ